MQNIIPYSIGITAGILAVNQILSKTSESLTTRSIYETRACSEKIMDLVLDYIKNHPNLENFKEDMAWNIEAPIEKTLESNWENRVKAVAGSLFISLATFVLVTEIASAFFSKTQT